METKFNFKSQMCTTVAQSERLLALGLKKDTADMSSVRDLVHTTSNGIREVIFTFTPYNWEANPDSIPRWSLHRLIEIMPQVIGHLELAVNDEFVGYYEDRCESETGMYWEHAEESSNLYDNILYCIEWLIKEGYFNKEYLVNQAEIEEHCKGVLEYLDYIRGGIV